MAKKTYKFQVQMYATVEVEAYCEDEACCLANSLRLTDLSNIEMEPPKILEKALDSDID